MFYLVLAICSSALISIIMRASEARVKGGTSMLAMNYLMCMLIAGALMGFGNILPKGTGLGLTLGLGCSNGVLYLAGFTLFQYSVKQNGVVLSATFMKLGLLIPMIVSVIFFHETPAAMQIAGFIIAIGAIILINLDKSKSAVQFKLGLILVLIAGGSGDAMSKVFEQLGSTAHSEQFLFYTFATALVLCVVLMLLKKERPGKWEALFGLLIGIPNYFSARFLLKALDTVPAVIAYPTYSVATIVAVSLAGVCIFRECLGKRQWTAIALILVSLVLLNV